jgi:diguanylate cyclase (GGDEF)-like protein
MAASSKRVSTYLTLLGVFLFLMAAALFVMAYFTVRNLEDDARIINQFGIIRGSIQRLVKLALTDCENDPCDRMIVQIDGVFQELRPTGGDGRPGFRQSELGQKLMMLEQTWEELLGHLRTYHTAPDPVLRAHIIRLSEQCWETADMAVLSAQITTENKVAGIRLVYFLLTANILNSGLLIWLIHQNVRKKLEFQAYRDGLTGLYNKRYFELDFSAEIARSLRYQREMILVIFDIDHFKRVNDTFGHRLGDKVLVQLARLMTATVRQSDTVYRIGGEEFAIIAPETGAETGLQMAEKLRLAVAQQSFHPVQQLTISLGVAALAEGDTRESLFERADKALYRAKESGRNRVAAGV